MEQVGGSAKGMQAQAADAAAPPALLLAGAHHRGGSEMLTRMLGALCKKLYGVSRWKPHSPSLAQQLLSLDAATRPPPACLVDVETSAAQSGLNSSAIAALYYRGVRLLSSGRWSLSPLEMDRVLGSAGVPYRFVHIVRSPMEVTVSSYLYHLTTTEPWAHVRDPPWAKRMNLRPPLPAAHSFSSHLNSLNRSEGVALQAQHSLRLVASMVAVAEQCARVPMQRCTNLPLGSFLSNFDSAARQLLDSLGVPSARHAGLLPVLRRVGKLSEAQARASSHVTRGKDETTRRALFHALGEAPCCYAALRRLETRLRLATGGGVRPAASSADNGAMDAERPRCIWHRGAGGRSGGGWWSSAEPTRVIVGTTAPGLLPGHGSNVHRRTVHNATPLTPQSCCERCRAAVDPGCLYFNYASGNARPLARCTLLSSRLAFFPSKRVLTGAA